MCGNEGSGSKEGGVGRSDKTNDTQQKRKVCVSGRLKNRSRSKSPPDGNFSFAAHNRYATSSSICEA